jgi:hypothetical protein
VTRERAAGEVARRAEAPVGDIAGAIRAVVDHYERVGDDMLRLLAQEDRFAALREITDGGRRIHYAWVERAFSPFLRAAEGAQRRRLRAQLIVITDVFTWKLLRHDLGMCRRQAEVAMAGTTSALLEGGI